MRRPRRRAPSAAAPRASAAGVEQPPLRDARTDRRSTFLRDARGNVDIERRQLLERREAEAFQELEPGPVQERPTGRFGPTELDDEAAMQQCPDGVVGIDATDPL